MGFVSCNGAIKVPLDVKDPLATTYIFLSHGTRPRDQVLFLSRVLYYFFHCSNSMITRQDNLDRRGLNFWIVSQEDIWFEVSFFCTCDHRMNIRWRGWMQIYRVGCILTCGRNIRRSKGQNYCILIWVRYYWQCDHRISCITSIRISRVTSRSRIIATLILSRGRHGISG